ncbi:MULTISPECIES: nuclear transport factor 2 family protein [Prauserella salsuginis group]|uniref:Nuclear transport factor 2 family protein n=1 Tax=Prauserella salsuginis TaxID=387889 RepID=A0ABW6G3K6_9PSEU|nr:MULTISPECIES: nuclear transport factor 2 family protein [Prauserella salsuginis group]MCR3718662.1 hypothetical protein [Prauserella flava]MCR3733232.1 hypothetical protein [Prauserella salsuginis]
MGIADHRAEIENLLGVYTFAYDENDMTAMAGCFTADAVMSMRVADGDLVGPFEGRDQIVGLMEKSLASQNDQRRHLVSNVVVRDLTDDTATVTSYLTLISIADQTLAVLSTARYEDELARENGAWRFARRHVQLDLPY